MFRARIKNVWDLVYVNPKEIADAKNSKEIISKYSDGQEIPIRILEINDWGRVNCIVLAGEGALYPWKRGEEVIIIGTGIISQIVYLRELCIRDINNAPYQDFFLYESISPIIQGKEYPDEGAIKYIGILSFQLYIKLAEVVRNIYAEKKRN